MGTQETYREAHRRRHRLLGSYLALSAWTKGVDCVVIQRDELLGFLELQTMQDTRIAWVKQDIKSLFPYSFTTEDDTTSVYRTFFLSRSPFPKKLRLATMEDDERVDAFNDAGLKAAIIELPLESEVVRIMAFL